MDLVGFRGERVCLLPPDREAHLENALRWMNDPAVTAMIEFHLGVTRRQEEEFFERVERDRETALHWAIHTLEGRHVGFIGLHKIDWPHRLTTGGLLIGERDAWGLGYATDAVQIRSRIVFEELGLHRLEGHTFNPAMRRVYEKCGYRHEGTARERIWRNGRWHDVELFSLLEADYFAARTAPAT